MKIPKHVISFVVDAQPIFQTQAWFLLHNLQAVLERDEASVLLNHCGALSPEVERKADECGVVVRPINRFGDGAAAYCNKLQQFGAVLATGARFAVLCDTDLCFLTSPFAWVSTDAVRAKPVDGTNPPEPVLRRLFDMAGMPATPLDYLPVHGRSHNRGRTHRLNCNGGLYIMPTTLLQELAPVWRKWSKFCLKQGKVLGKSLSNSDQLGFALAMLETGLPFEPLKEEQNFPLHFPADDYLGSMRTEPLALHYHREMKDDGTLASPVRIGTIRDSVDRLNALMQSAREDLDFRALLKRSHTTVSV